jgi:hypothetical protein
MADEGTLHPSLVAGHLRSRILEIWARTRAELVTSEEAADLAHLTRQMIEVLYEVPARIARSRRSKRAAASDQADVSNA